MLASSGYLCQVDADLCLACGECIPTCPFEALSLGEYTSVIDETNCMGCGICTSKCLQGALSLRRAEEKGEPLEIHALISASRL